MMVGNTSDIRSELMLYTEQFGEAFPLMQANGDSNHVKAQIVRCIMENKKASELWPDVYGACEGKIV